MNQQTQQQGNQQTPWQWPYEHQNMQQTNTLPNDPVLVSLWNRMAGECELHGNPKDCVNDDQCGWCTNGQCVPGTHGAAIPAGLCFDPFKYLKSIDEIMNFYGQPIKHIQNNYWADTQNHNAWVKDHLKWTSSKKNISARFIQTAKKDVSSLDDDSNIEQLFAGGMNKPVKKLKNENSRFSQKGDDAKDSNPSNEEPKDENQKTIKKASEAEGSEPNDKSRDD